MLSGCVRQPRNVQYECSACSGLYETMTSSNPWWDLQPTKCKLCLTTQIPKFDIGNPLNSLEHDSFYRLTFYEFGDKNESVEDLSCSPRQVDKFPSSYVEEVFEDLAQMTCVEEQHTEESLANSSDTEQEQSASDTRDSLSLSVSSTNMEYYRFRFEKFISKFDAVKLIILMTHASLSLSVSSTNMEYYRFRFEKFISKFDAVKLIILMTHARLCTGIHFSQEHTDLCQNIKLMMLHLRDCTNDDCEKTWCLCGKFICHHLSHCYCPTFCVLCTPTVEVEEVFREIHTQNLNVLSSFHDKKF